MSWLKSDACKNAPEMIVTSADVPGADVLVKIGRRVKCSRKTRHSADVPGADVLVETAASERLVTWLTSQALMSWLKLDAE